MGSIGKEIGSKPRFNLTHIFFNYLRFWSLYNTISPLPNFYYYYEPQMILYLRTKKNQCPQYFTKICSQVMQ